MGAGDITIVGPANVDDSAAIILLLSGAAIVADDITSWTAGNQVWFGIVKAA